MKIPTLSKASKIALFALIAAAPAVAFAAQYGGTVCFPWCPFCP